MPTKTEQNTKSEEKGLSLGLTAVDLNMFLAEDDEGLKKSRRIFEKAYELAVNKGDSKVLIDLMNRMMGRPKESISLKITDSPSLILGNIKKK